MNTEALFTKMMEYYTGDPQHIQHFVKVHSFALRIALGEGLDEKTTNVLETVAIVHDVGIKKSIEIHGHSTGKLQELEGPPIAREILRQLNYPQDIVDRVCYIVAHHHTYTDIQGLDYQILVEADFLVNMFESNMTDEAISNAYNNIFRTETGKRICKTMYRGLITA
ncbi:MAG: HD domain-containing protein [Clostridiales bacterium]|nr:HD domain-containing protein [Clostridiales bacterium]